MRYLVCVIALVVCASCERTEQEVQAARAGRAKSATDGNYRYWEWVESTVACKKSERLGVCLCVFHWDAGIADSSTSEMGLSWAPDSVCDKVK